MTHPARKGIYSPGQDLLAAIRAGFVVQKTSMSEWCRDHDVIVQNARMAILGGWCGPKAQQLVEKLKKAAGVS